MREKLIDIVEDYADFLDWDTKEEMVDSIMEFLATDKNVGHKWIPVTERLPNGAKPYEIAENVIALTESGEVTTGWLEAGGGKWWLVIGTDDTHTCWGLGYVTHWMPLPQAPKENDYED